MADHRGTPAYKRWQAENERRSKAMAESQRPLPPAPASRQPDGAAGGQDPAPEVAAGERPGA